MNQLLLTLADVATDLTRAGRPWALVGGFAVSARTSPRFTNDIHLVVAVAGDDEAERCTQALLAGGYQLFGAVEHESGRLATVRLRRGKGDAEAVVDILFASSGIEPEIADDAESLEIVPGLELPVATVGHLIALKVLARDDDARPQDYADLRGLLAAASEYDLAVARSAVRLIQERGFDRGRDLPNLLEDLIAPS